MYIALCGALLAVGLFICLGLLFSTDPRSDRALWTIGMPFMMLSIVYFIPGLAGGIGLLRGKSWARVVMIALSALVLFLIPVGTALGIYGIWVLWQSPSAPPSQPPSAAGATSPVMGLPALSAEQRSRYGGLLLAMAGVACAFIIAIGTGFRVTRDPAPSPIDSLYFPAILGLMAVIATAVVKIRRSGFQLGTPPVSQWSGAERARKSHDRAESEQREAERSRRLATLAADPVRRKYVERMQSGEWWWSDEAIAYDLDPSALATCPHLQPIERVMRTDGINVRLQHDTKVLADCCVDYVKLAEQFTLAPSVHYREPAAYDRSLEDPPAALIACDACQSVIDVVHRLRSRADTPWFPA
jgi:hypothetical protein